MQDILLTPPLTEVGPTLPDIDSGIADLEQRSLRLVITKGYTEWVGFREVYFYNGAHNYSLSGGIIGSTGTNLLTPGRYPTKNMYDGRFVWTSSAYTAPKEDRSSFFQFNFSTDINLTGMLLYGEGNYVPKDDGVELYVYKNNRYEKLYITASGNWKTNGYVDYSVG